MKKSTYTYIEIPVSIYRCTVVVFIGATVESIIARGKKQGIHAWRFRDDWVQDVREGVEGTNLGFVVSYGVDCRDIILWLRKPPNTLEQQACLVHEISHVVDKIAFDTCHHGWTTKDGTSEPRAYLAEYLFTQIKRALKPAKRKAK